MQELCMVGTACLKTARALHEKGEGIVYRDWRQQNIVWIMDTFWSKIKKAVANQQVQ